MTHHDECPSNDPAPHYPCTCSPAPGTQHPTGTRVTCEVCGHSGYIDRWQFFTLEGLVTMADWFELASTVAEPGPDEIAFHREILAEIARLEAEANDA